MMKHATILMFYMHYSIKLQQKVGTAIMHIIEF